MLKLSKLTYMEEIKKMIFIYLLHYQTNMTHNTNNSIICVYNDTTISKEYMCDNICRDMNIDTLLVIYIPVAIIILFSIIYKIIECKYLSIKPKYSNKQNQCEFTVPHHIVIEPDNSLSIILN